MTTITTFVADHAWRPAGWARDAEFSIDARGQLRAAAAAARGESPRLGRWLLPGIPNLHSHAFQRAMAGLTERQTHPQDSFWTWRELMYAFAARLTPEALRDIAAMLYAEMLEAGYTSVCEFHYLHHAPDGRAYADPAQMSLALIEAARETGIGLTLLPTLYMTGGFDGRALGPRQQRFGHDVDAYLRLVDRLRTLESDTLRVGLCFHSLRAVPEDAMRAVLDATGRTPMPIHLHIAEQLGEVQDSLAIRNARPVEWLLERFAIDERWTLVHATHLSDTEVPALARSGATVAICTTTEANLGDGFFPLRSYLDAGGQWGVGSDSHISVSPIEELRWLEYGQRLVTKRRNIAVQSGNTSTGESLLTAAWRSGAQATGRSIGMLDEAARADFVVLDENAPELACASVDNLVDRWIFSGNRNLVRDVYVGGKRVVSQGRHLQREAIETRYRAALEELLRAP